MAMAMTNPSITFRIVWCRRLRRQAPTRAEEEGWLAEEQGLRDALLTRDHSYHYRSQLPSVFDRYLLGFQDAQALIRMASMVLDEERPAHVLRCLLEYENHQALEASHSHRGLERHRERSAALLITDLAMTKM